MSPIVSGISGGCVSPRTSLSSRCIYFSPMSYRVRLAPTSARATALARWKPASARMSGKIPRSTIVVAGFSIADLTPVFQQ
jgi:hypothetical protein